MKKRSWWVNHHFPPLPHQYQATSLIILLSSAGRQMGQHPQSLALLPVPQLVLSLLGGSSEAPRKRERGAATAIGRGGGAREQRNRGRRTRGRRTRGRGTVEGETETYSTICRQLPPLHLCHKRANASRIVKQYGTVNYPDS